MNDLQAYQEYRRSQGLDAEEVKTKGQKINYLLKRHDWKKSDLQKLKAKQLYKIIQKV